jgi:signal transduction histidine kinase
VSLPRAWLPQSLRSRLMIAFCGFAVVVIGLFALYALIFAFTVEDEFFARMLKSEVTYLRAGRASDASKAWPHPRLPGMQVLSIDAFPTDLRREFLAEPKRHEFPGEQGRHYHIAPLHDTPDGPWLVAEVSQQLVFRGMRQTVIEVLGYSAIGTLLVALSLAWWLSHSTTKGLSELSQTVRNLAPQNLPRRLPLPRTPHSDEVGVVAQGIDDLLERVADYVQREQEFTRDASHELRTPLAVLRGTHERLLAALGHQPEWQATLSDQRRALDHASQSVAHLLELARLDQRQPWQTEAYRLLPLVERSILDQSGRIAERPNAALDVQVEIDSALSSHLDPRILRLLLDNLIGNALLHSANGTITIGADANHCWVQNPIAKDAPGALFEPFAKAETSTGYGLGLTIIRRLDQRFQLDLLANFDAPCLRISFRHSPRVG